MGQHLLSIVLFTPLAGWLVLPVSLAVLLDVSDSMFGQRLVDARSAVERFLFDLLTDEDEFSVIAFNHEPGAVADDHLPTFPQLLNSPVLGLLAEPHSLSIPSR